MQKYSLNYMLKTKRIPSRVVNKDLSNRAVNKDPSNRAVSRDLSNRAVNRDPSNRAVSRDPSNRAVTGVMVDLKLAMNTEMLLFLRILIKSKKQ